MRKAIGIGMCLLLFAGGCSSDNMNAWATRIDLQVAMQEKTMDGMYAAQFKNEEQNQDRSIDSAYADTIDAFVNKATTQPFKDSADQRKWLKEQQDFLKMQLKESRANEATLRARQAVSSAGFDGIREAVQHIRDINAAWYRQNADTSAAILNLATQIQQLRAEKAGGR